MTTSRDPDRAIEQLLRQPSTGPLRAGTPCLDGETIAAWYEGALSGQARLDAEAHVADCARCQAIVGEVVRAAAAAGVVPAPTPRRLFRWLVPVTAAAAALAIWIATPEPPRTFVTEQAPVPTIAGGRDAVITPAAPSASPEVASPPAALPSAAAAPQEAAPARERAESRALKSDDRPDAADSAANAPAPTPVPPAAVAAPPAIGALNETVATFRSVAPAVTAVVPNSTVMWRAIRGTVERSDDAGASWAQVFAADVNLTALAAPTPLVCWAVGPGGTVFRSTDGRSFARVQFPEPLDLVAVSASDATSAAVAARDGRTFSTSDGGLTWTRR